MEKDNALTNEKQKKKETETTHRPSRHKKNAEAGRVPVDVKGDEETLEQRLERAEKEARENYDRFLRVSAEFDNYKKRMAKEKEDYRKFANESLLKALLPVVDNLERAIEAAGKEERAEHPIVQGIELTLSEILKVFEKFAVKPIKALNEPFDPVYHQAVMQEVSDQHPGNTVIKELQKGYLLHDRLLRPAMVVVSKPSESSKTQHQEEAVEDSHGTDVQ